jgi:malate dehydrogenase (oxaloacetate-decarboxylating)
MAADPIVFAMANPDPEIRPELIQDVAAVIATGRSDFPNQINNVLAFPGIFRGALDVRARQISEGMKVAAAQAIADVITDDELHEDYIIPSVFNPDVAPAVAAETRRVAIEEGLARITPED